MRHAFACSDRLELLFPAEAVPRRSEIVEARAPSIVSVPRCAARERAFELFRARAFHEGVTLSCSLSAYRLRAGVALAAPPILRRQARIVVPHCSAVSRGRALSSGLEVIRHSLRGVAEARSRVHAHVGSDMTATPVRSNRCLQLTRSFFNDEHRRLGSLRAGFPPGSGTADSRGRPLGRSVCDPQAALSSACVWLRRVPDVSLPGAL